MGIKDFFKKLKEDNKYLKTTMERINSSDLCGAVNRGVKGGDFTDISYVSVEGAGVVIYGSNQPDCYIKAGDVESFEIVEKGGTMVSVGDKKHPANRCILKLVDGRKAQVDIIGGKMTAFTTAIGR